MLVCSAIIESGLDVPNANTIIIDRADHFGLAQLYQLRGRVGRSHERAYAYLMIPGEQLISREAQLRLRALQELDDLGGGFKLAAHDLEIRGAGNLLGKQQSGQIAAVGFELYQQMMEEAVQELRGAARAAGRRAGDPARHPGLHSRELHPRRESAAGLLPPAGVDQGHARSRSGGAASCAIAMDRFRRRSTASCASWTSAAA